MNRVSRAGILAAYRDGVTVICELAAQFTDATWLAATPCTEWRAVDLAGHLRCVADDYHEYLDDAPASRLARLMATGVSADSLARKLERFRLGSVLVETVDTVQPTLVAALKMAAPKDTGTLADRIYALRHTKLVGGARVDLVAVTDVPYAGFVLRGTKPHTIVPVNAKALSWMGVDGDQTFATIVQHPGTKPNPFPHRVWISLREPIMFELVAQIKRKLYE